MHAREVKSPGSQRYPQAATLCHITAVSIARKKKKKNWRAVSFARARAQRDDAVTSFIGPVNEGKIKTVVPRATCFALEKMPGDCGSRNLLARRLRRAFVHRQGFIHCARARRRIGSLIRLQYSRTHSVCTYAPTYRGRRRDRIKLSACLTLEFPRTGPRSRLEAATRRLPVIVSLSSQQQVIVRFNRRRVARYTRSLRRREAPGWEALSPFRSVGTAARRVTLISLAPIAVRGGIFSIADAAIFRYVARATRNARCAISP